jgi:hypothetical protein
LSMFLTIILAMKNLNIQQLVTQNKHHHHHLRFLQTKVYAPDSRIIFGSQSREDGTVAYLTSAENSEPTDHRMAMQDQKCRQAMEEEYRALMKNDTWELNL